MKQRILMILLACVVIGVVLIVGSSLMNRKPKDKFDIKLSSQTVIKELRELNRLETASYTIEKVIDAGTSGNTFQEFLYGDRILLIAHGEVIAGIDLSSLEEDDIDIEGDTVKVTLPAPRVLITTLDNDQTRVYDRQQGLLSRGNKDLESQARITAEKAITDAACKGNILSEASNNARKQLTTLLRAVGFTTVIIDIPQASC